MSVPDKSIDPRILESAKKEFLSHGFEAALLGDICRNAGVTTGALYKRYKGKEDLFEAIVSPCVESLFEFIDKKMSHDISIVSDETLVNAWKMDEAYMLWWFEYLYKWHDEMVLLLVDSKGTKYDNFQHDFVQKMTTGFFLYYKEAYKRDLCCRKISYNELHILLSAFWTTIYEPFIHGYSFEEIKKYTPLVCSLFDWNKALEIKN